MKRKHEDEQSDDPEKKILKNLVNQEVSTLTSFTPSHHIASTHTDSTDIASIHIASTDLNPTHIVSSHTGTNSLNDMASSSSTTPIISKKIQKKIDKSRALQEFRLQQKSDKPKLCPSYKQDTHARSTSNLCPNKKKKETKFEADEFTKQFVIKTSLKNTCKNQLFAKNLAQVVEYTNMIIHVGSLFVNFVFLKLLGNAQAIPVIEQNLFASMFALITGIGYSSLLNIATKQYETFIRNYIHDTHERRSTMSDKNSNTYRKNLPVASRKALAYYIYHKKQGSSPTWPSNVQNSPENIETTEKLLTLWSTYQPDSWDTKSLYCDSDTLYSKPHLFFKWFYVKSY
ncbi:hypothetical protein BD408DRAFT_101635 [Parasitella parasitica]|nr:hypothetical protein BD408DRAFT_101635 [Parasitella parasitica]